MTKTTQPEFDAYRDTYVDTVEQSISFSGLSHDFFQRSKALMIRDLLGWRTQITCIVSMMGNGSRSQTTASTWPCRSALCITYR